MEPNDPEIARILHEWRIIAKDLSTPDKMTAGYNYLVGVFRLFTVRGDQKWVEGLAKDIQKGLLKEIRDAYKSDLQ